MIAFLCTTFDLLMLSTRVEAAKKKSIASNENYLGMKIGLIVGMVKKSEKQVILLFAIRFQFKVILSFKLGKEVKPEG